MPASVPISGYPFEDQDTTETQYSRIFRELQDPGVMGSAGSNLLAASFPGGMVVRVTPGRAYGNGYVGEVTADKDVEPTPAESQSRVDRLVIRLNPTLNTATLEVLKGTRGSSVPPAITRTDAGAYDVKLFRFTVGAGAPGPTDLVDEREWVSHRVRNWTTETRPSGADLRRGAIGVNHTTQRLEWNPTGVDGEWLYVLDARDRPADTTLGRTEYVGPVGATLAITPVWTPLAPVTATSSGGRVRARVDLALQNLASGADRDIAYRVLCDGVEVPGGGILLTAPLGQTSASSWEWEHTPAAGPHTWTISANANGPAGGVKPYRAVLTVVERN